VVPALREAREVKNAALERRRAGVRPKGGDWGLMDRGDASHLSAVSAFGVTDGAEIRNRGAAARGSQR